MKKKKNKGKRKVLSKKQKIIIMKKRKRRLRIFLSVLFIGIIVISYNKIVSSKVDLISSRDINYYINVADNYSRARGQLNWKEIAAVDAAVNNEKFCESSDARVEVIANAFYKEDNNKKDFNSTLEALDLSNNQKEDAKKILEELKDISLRIEYEGQNKQKDSFIASIEQATINNYKKYGALPSVTMAQAILESEWGTSKLASQYNNFFGIKADKSWSGAIATFKTNENYNDVITANFRAYNSVEESIYDLGKFLNDNGRYKNAGFFDAKNYIEQANALENAGYATIKNEVGELIYADLLIEVIKENNLMIYDAMI